MLMEAHPHPTKQTDGPAEDAIIEIVGANTFNQDLLAGYLQQESGVRCFGSRDRRYHATSEQPLPEIRLVLFDCTDMRWPAIEPWIASMVAPEDTSGLAVCFNVTPHFHIEQDALRQGVRGVIYTDAPTDIYPRAVNAILSGELWYSRNVLQRFLEAPVYPKDGLNREAVLKLTQREQSILLMIATGHSNKEIAEDLCISPHTVKTHIYNLFKKINVTNRFQAASWLNRNKQAG